MEYSGQVFIYLIKDVLRYFLTTHRGTEQLEGRLAIYYLDAVNASVDAAIDGGFLLPVDAALIVADAEASGIGGP